MSCRDTTSSRPFRWVVTRSAHVRRHPGLWLSPAVHRGVWVEDQKRLQRAPPSRNLPASQISPTPRHGLEVVGRLVRRFACRLFDQMGFCAARMSYAKLVHPPALRASPISTSHLSSDGRTHTSRASAGRAPWKAGRARPSGGVPSGVRKELPC